MKLLMFAPIFPPAIGGPATQCYSLCRALHERGEEPVVLTPGKGFERKSPDGYPVYRYPWRYTGTVLDKPLRWIVFTLVYLYVVARERPQIMHAHSVSAPSFIAGAIAKLLGIPTVIKFAGDWVWETLSTSRLRGKDFKDIYESTSQGRFLLRVEKIGVSLFTVIWTPSKFRRQNVIDLLGTDEKVRIIPNSLILPPGGVHLESEGDIITVVSANRFIPHKRVSTIARAFKKADVPNSRLVLIGGGDEKEVEAVRKTIAEEGLSDRVELPGILSSAEIYKRFASASFYVSASLEEGFPNVFIEAMHFGLPIVATDVGGCNEMVHEAETGFLVDPMDEEALSNRMKLLMEDKELRNRQAEAAYASSTQYDLTVVVDRFLELYRSLLQKP